MSDYNIEEEKQIIRQKINEIMEETTNDEDSKRKEYQLVIDEYKSYLRDHDWKIIKDNR